MIVFNKVNKNYGTNVGLKDATVHIEKGDFVFLVGPSGAGKTTFVRLILKEIEADSGTILVGGRDVTRMTHREIPELRQQIGMVFQDFRLLEKKTVYENVAFAMEVRHKKKKVIRKEVPFALDLVGIADEPTGNLDPVTAMEIMQLLEKINVRGTTILMVTHAKDIVDQMNKRVVAIKDGQIVRDEQGTYGITPEHLYEISTKEDESPYVF